MKNIAIHRFGLTRFGGALRKGFSRLIALPMLLGALAGQAQAAGVAVTFTNSDGALGIIGKNSQKWDDVTLFSNQTVTAATFTQDLGDGATSFQIQGNDIPGSLTLTTAAGDVVMTGAIVSQDKTTGNVTMAFAFIPYAPTNVSVNGIPIQPNNGVIETGDDVVVVVLDGQTPGYTEGQLISASADQLDGVLDELNRYLELQNPTTVVSVGDATEQEGADLVHTVDLSRASVDSKNFAYSLAGVTATGGVDYTTTPIFSNGVTLASGTLIVPAGVSSFTITYPGLDDSDDEDSETYTVTVGGQSGTGTINDNDVVTVGSVGDASETEGTNLVHTVTLSGTTGVSTDFAYVLADVTATGDADYTATPTFPDGFTLDAESGVITVPAGVDSFTITYKGLDDAEVEDDETYTLKVGGKSGTGTITDNDANPSLKVTKTADVSGLADPVEPNKEGAPSTIKYSIAVENTGNVPLSSVSVNDPLLSGSPLVLQSGDANSNNILDVDEIWGYAGTYDVTNEAVQDRFIENTVSVRAEKPGGDVGDVDDDIKDSDSVKTELSRTYCDRKIDIWFANDESGSIDADEFRESLNFLYQVSDAFEWDAVTGSQGALFAWSDKVTNIDGLEDVTADFGDIRDYGVLPDRLTTVDAKVGIRDLYGPSKVTGGGGTHLAEATNYLKTIISTSKKDREGVPNVAVILTDAFDTQLTRQGDNKLEGGDAWEKAAKSLRDEGVQLVVMLIDEAADAYDDPTTGAAVVVLNVVGNDKGNIFVGNTYSKIADPSEEFIGRLATTICDAAAKAAPPNTSPDAVDDSNNVKAGATLTVANDASGDVLLNDTDDDGDALVVSAVRTGDEAADDGTPGDLGVALQGTYGTLTLSADGSYTYVADAQTSTTSDLSDVFTYTVSDGNGGSDTAEISIRIDVPRLS
jgi:uncharacterized repeat protein (TIGR01451 family)